MTAKAKNALRKILSDSDISYEDMCSLAIRKAKEHKLSVDYLLKLRREIHGVAACSDGGEKVAVIVQDLVDRSFGQLHGRLARHVGIAGGEEGGASDTTGTPSNTQLDTTAATNIVRQLANTPACEQGFDTIEPIQTMVEPGADLGMEGDREDYPEDMVCVPKAVLSSLISKVDLLYISLQKQREEFLDVEQRLKFELRAKTNSLSEKIDGLLSSNWANVNTHDHDLVAESANSKAIGKTEHAQPKHMQGKRRHTVSVKLGKNVPRSNTLKRGGIIQIYCVMLMQLFCRRKKVSM